MRLTAQTGDPQIDSLISLYDRLPDSDTSRITVCFQLSKYHFNVDSTEFWSNRLISMARKRRDYQRLCDGLGNLSWAYFYQDKINEAIATNYRGIILADSISYPIGKAFHYYMLGINYSSINDYQESDRYFNFAIDIYKAQADTLHLVRCYRCMADNFLFQRAYHQAEITYNQCLALDSLGGDDVAISEDLYSLGLSKFVQYVDNPHKPDISLIIQAKKSVNDCLNFNESDLASFFRKHFVLQNCLFYELMHYKYTGSRRRELLDSMADICTYNTDNALKFGESMEWSSHVCLVNYNVANGDFVTAKRFLDSLETMDLHLDAENQRFYYLAFRNYYMAAHDTEKSLYYTNQYYGYLLNTMSVDNAISTANRILRNEFDTRIQEQTLREERRTMMITVVASLVLLIIIFMGILFYRNLKHTQMLNTVNAVLIQQKEEILAQKDELAKTHLAITDSISYASLIQRAVMPSEDAMQNLFREYFLLYKPLNTVAGDYYWACQIGKWKILVCADCTGHGVPGAFLSMLGVTLLEEVCTQVVSVNGNAADVLNDLRYRLMHALGQSRELYENGVNTNTDGMDMALLMFNQEDNTLHYSGAFRPLWIYRGGQIIEYRADRMPVGLYLGPERDFANNEILVEPGDILYVFSDGIPDQFGYVDKERKVFKHFQSRRFMDLLKNIGHLDLQEQKKIVDKAVLDWQNGFRQIDDIILLAVKI